MVLSKTLSKQQQEKEDGGHSDFGSDSFEKVRLLPGGEFLVDKTQLSRSARKDDDEAKSRMSALDTEAAAAAGKAKEEEGKSSMEELATAVAIDSSELGSDERRHSERSDWKPSDEPSSEKGKKSFRAKLVHTPSRRSSYSTADDRTIRCERYFLKKIERHKNRRLERFCICPVTKWLLFKVSVLHIERICEKIARMNAVLLRAGRCFWICCCPPLCRVMPQIALWPPPSEYFFYVDNIPPRERKEVEGRKEAIEIAERKKKIPKISHANKKVWKQKEPLRIGHKHPCADDIDDVEAFVVRTRKNNYVACVRIPSRGICRYSILYSHPNASDLSDHLVGVPNLMDVARFHKCDVYSYDYSGYGISSGHASESNQKADIRAVYDYMLNERGILPHEIVLIGYSIGCFASVYLASTTQQPPAGLVLQSPPTSVLRVLLWERCCFKKPFTQRSCCADRFSTYDKIAGVSIPVLVIHGEDDRTVPIIHGKAVCDRAVNRAAPLWLRATHDNIENCRETWVRIRKFIKYELKGGSNDNQD